MRLAYNATSCCAAFLLALSTASLVFGYALFFLPPAEAAKDPATWLCSLTVATATLFGHFKPNRNAPS